jgi:tRNA (guanine37-N1)-methyltransferase
MRFDILTIFPNIFDSYLDESLVKRARKAKILSVTAHDLRKFTTDKHQKVDDRPFGGGPGMVLKVEPVHKAVTAILKRSKAKKKRVILFSLRGKKLDEKAAQRLAKYDQLVMICGRYEGVDERVAESVADEEISIGDYVLSGGELPALVTMEAVARYLPGFLGKYESLESVKGSYPVYTRPVEFKLGKKNLKVPSVLLSGNHKDIEAWRTRS